MGVLEHPASQGPHEPTAAERGANAPVQLRPNETPRPDLCQRCSRPIFLADLDPGHPARWLHWTPELDILGLPDYHPAELQTKAYESGSSTKSYRPT